MQVNMKKKLLFLTSILVAANVVALSGCGNPDPGDNPDPDPSHEKGPTEAVYHTEIANQEVTIDSTGFGEINVDNHDIIFSGVKDASEGIVTIDDRGIVANKSAFNTIFTLDINFASLATAKLYYGSSFLSFVHSIELKPTNRITFENTKNVNYFVIQSEGESVLQSISVGYGSNEVVPEDDLPVFKINTENAKPVTSRTTYVNCDIEVEDVNDPINNLPVSAGAMKVRGESSSACPKKNYRIKFNKKQSLFGLKKNKSWVLQADYMDGSKLHNYSAYDFARMVRKDGSFCINQRHVQVILNGKDIGIYLFAEHINENAGRLNIEQTEVWKKSFDEINFYVERNLYPDTEEKSRSFEIIPPSTYYSHIKKLVFILKYPTSEDFEEELEDGTINKHTEEYNAFFAALQVYYNNVCEAFFRYHENSTEHFHLIDEAVDLKSLAMWGAIDQMFAETDHEQKSFKMYRQDGKKLCFGPNWDYDSCVDGLHFNNYKYERYPYTSPERLINRFYHYWFWEKWGYMLYQDTKNGRHYFKEIWDNISDEDINNYLNAQIAEHAHLSAYYKTDTHIWMDNEYRAVFDNLTFHYSWISTEINYLKHTIYK